MILDSFRCATKDLLDPCLSCWSMLLRLEGDPDDPNTWHLVKKVDDYMFQGVNALTVAFHDETLDTVLNETDQVEFAVLRPLKRTE
jgi:hypothetical protein